jgi:segregation and condensation protein A
VLIAIGLDDFARLAAEALKPKEAPTMALGHLHAPLVSVREQAVTLVQRLRRTRTTTFRALTADSPDLMTTVARFLALLELYREGAVSFDQVSALGEISVRWIGTDEGDILVGDEYDDHAVLDELSGPPAEKVTDEDVARIGELNAPDHKEAP